MKINLLKNSCAAMVITGLILVSKPYTVHAAKPLQVIFYHSDQTKHMYQNSNFETTSNLFVQKNTDTADRLPIKLIGISRSMKIEKELSLYLNGKNIKQGAEVDFDHALSKMWQKKLSISRVTPATIKNAQQIIDRYKSEKYERMTITQLIHNADEQINLSYNSMNWNSYCHSMSLDAQRCEILRKLAHDINGKGLVSYGMTEVMPCQDGDKNRDILNALLQNAGFNFVNKIPAIYDTKFSFGFYQFTSGAVRYDSNGPEGANKVSKYSKAKIAGSVMFLTSDQQHRAAFYFAVLNITRLLKILDPIDLSKLDKEHSRHKIELVQFIAIAHHMPAPASRQAAQWVHSNFMKPLVSYLSPALSMYASKTKSNYEAI